ncbi:MULTISPECIES: sensor histidine kinase [Streptomyces]|uniref:sensor histidine kinase n=1 Tax=Streptomyces TaxID=1883 RepID=UPI001FF42AF6|nr:MULTISPECIES: histidine kinase [Streptomyces]WJD99355.1 histidine kinase [Streptomyces antimycoticus]
MPDDAGNHPPRHHDNLAPRLAVVITVLVLVGYFAVAVTYVVDGNRSGRTIDAAMLGLALLPMTMLLCLQMLHSFPGLAPRLSGARRRTLALQTVLTFAPFAVFKHAWLGMPGFLAGSSLLVLAPALAWPAFAAILLCTDVLLFQVGFGWGQVAYTSVSTALTGLVVFGLSRLSGLVAEVSRSRAELARLAVAQERLRFSRDVHDLLGYSLSTITLKCELVHRLVPRQNSRAQQELSEILQTSRQALADVRAVASGYRKMSLSAESATARSMLAAAGISATSEIDCGPLPEVVDTVLASVLREGLTNVLRHSKADHCAIEARRSGRQVWLTLVNDGVGRPSTILRADSTDGGSGIGNLRVRVENLGGRLRAGVRSDGCFELRAELDVSVDAPPRSGRERGSKESKDSKDSKDSKEEYGPGPTVTA